MPSVRKGTKRAISPNATKSDPKRSPSTSKKSSAPNKGKPETRNGGNMQRKIFGELPCAQRKIVRGKITFITFVIYYIILFSVKINIEKH